MHRLPHIQQYCKDLPFVKIVQIFLRSKLLRQLMRTVLFFVSSKCGSIFITNHRDLKFCDIFTFVRENVFAKFQNKIWARY